MRAGHETCIHTNYLMDCEGFERLLDRAGDCCEVCGINRDNTSTGKLVIDHEHEFGFAAVRGLVCPSCNFQLGRVDRGKPAPAHLVDRVERYLANPWVREVTIEVRPEKRDERGELVMGDEMPSGAARVALADLLHAASVRGKTTFITSHGRRMAAIVPLSIGDEALARRAQALLTF